MSRSMGAFKLPKMGKDDHADDKKRKRDKKYKDYKQDGSGHIKPDRPYMGGSDINNY